MGAKKAQPGKPTVIVLPFEPFLRTSQELNTLRDKESSQKKDPRKPHVAHEHSN